MRVHAYIIYHEWIEPKHIHTIQVYRAQRACWKESGPCSSTKCMCWSCFSGLDEVMSGCVPWWRETYWTAALKIKKLITHHSPDHSMSYSLRTHLVSPTAPHRLIYIYIHTTHDSWSPVSNTSTHMYTHTHTHTCACQLIRLCLLII